jgi:mannose-6-phosphate isomerase-like protein (cupin superfamily)
MQQATHDNTFYKQRTRIRTLLPAPQTFSSVRHSIRKLKANSKALVALACNWLHLQLYVAYAIVESVAAPGCSLPLHLHRNEEEHLVVLAGTYRIPIEDKVLDAPVGTSVTVPRGSRHCWRSTICICAGKPHCNTFTGSPFIPGALISCIFRTGSQR